MPVPSSSSEPGSGTLAWEPWLRVRIEKIGRTLPRASTKVGVTRGISQYNFGWYDPRAIDPRGRATKVAPTEQPPRETCRHTDRGARHLWRAG